MQIIPFLNRHFLSAILKIFALIFLFICLFLVDWLLFKQPGICQEHGCLSWFLLERCSNVAELSLDQQKQSAPSFCPSINLSLCPKSWLCWLPTFPSPVQPGTGPSPASSTGKQQDHSCAWLFTCINVCKDTVCLGQASVIWILQDGFSQDWCFKPIFNTLLRQILSWSIVTLSKMPSVWCLCFIPAGECFLSTT